MSLSTKYLIGLTCTELDKEDLEPDAGFIDAYTYDINAPYLDHHLFLVYEWNANTAKKFKTSKKLKNLKSLYGYKTYTIKGKRYKIYTIAYINSFAIKSLKSGNVNIYNDDKLNVINFWKGSDTDINNFTINKHKKLISFDEKVIPEIDYIEPRRGFCQ